MAIPTSQIDSHKKRDAQNHVMQCIEDSVLWFLCLFVAMNSTLVLVERRKDKV